MQNFRCFNDHTVLFEPCTVVVGKNNAGKSSLIEALRLVSSVINRRGAQFTVAPGWLNLPRFRKGIAPRISQLGINLNSVFHRYGEPPAIITAKFHQGVVVDVYVGREETIFATIQQNSNWIDTAAKFLNLKLPWISVLPQIGPLRTEEFRLTDERVTTHLNSRLTSRHFRNQLLRMDTPFANFKALAEETWGGLRIDPIQETTTKEGSLLALPVRDGDFVAEVGWMGHGLQMWLQTIWFLSRTSVDCTVVLDEPDVYMHPDLQRKLFRLARARFRQCIVATHSVEIMAESDPGNILIIDKKVRKSQYANNEPGVQILIDQIGGVHNVHLARLWSARKFLLVEGKDIALLKYFHAALYPDAELPLDTIPCLPIGGWAGWPYAVGSSMTLRNAVGDRIETYCILDCDYHSDGEIRDRYTEAQNRGLNLHIWKRKEIENYLLQPNAIRRVLAARIKGGEVPSVEEIQQKILEICESERRAIEDAFASAMIQNNRKLDVISANKSARANVEKMWHSEVARLSIVSGKMLLTELSRWTQGKFDVAFGPPAIARQMKHSEFPTELTAVIQAIEDGSNFPSIDERNT
ncbi:MAG TPA: ATP-binding protein [Terracidiphilus sp.]|nr:ATP-binding protein [Terracidiphilus sp.]